MNRYMAKFICLIISMTSYAAGTDDEQYMENECMGQTEAQGIVEFYTERCSSADSPLECLETHFVCEKKSATVFECMSRFLYEQRYVLKEAPTIYEFNFTEIETN